MAEATLEAASSSSRQRRRWPRAKMRETALGFGTIVVFVLIWQLIYTFRVFPTWAFPSPIGVARGFVTTISDGSLLRNTWDSIVRQLVGVVLATVVAIPSGLMLGSSPTARAMFLPLCRLLYPIPGLAWVPLAILWFGVGFKSTVFVIFFTGVWPILFNTMAGVTTLSAQYTDVARVFMAPQPLYIWRILVPGSLPFMLTGIRLTYGVGWRVIIGAEMISSIHGLGFMIDNARWQLRPEIMVVGMVTIGLIGWVVENWAFDWLESVTIDRWGMKSQSV